MTKFYMTKAPLASDDIEPISVNLDNVLYISPFDEGAIFRMIDRKGVYVAEKYEDVMRNIKPFIPFDEMVNNEVDSKWMRNYLNKLPKGATLLVNDNNGQNV